VILALFVVPTLINNWHIKFDYKNVDLSMGHIKFFRHFKKYLQNFWSGIRGSAIGSIAGLVPHVTTYLASNVAYLIEKRTRMAKNTYHEKGDIQSLTSAETANNSAAFVQLMPLLLIGIPITTSEAILLTILETNSFIINYTTTIETGMFNELVIWFIAINVISFCLAWPLVRYVNMIYKIPVKILFAITFAVMLILLGYVGMQNYQTFYYFFCFIFLLPLGVVLRKTETIVVIIAFVLQDKIFAAITRALTIWSM
jgi:TctA family transporter